MYYYLGLQKFGHFPKIPESLRKFTEFSTLLQPYCFTVENNKTLFFLKK